MSARKSCASPGCEARVWKCGLCSRHYKDSAGERDTTSGEHHLCVEPDGENELFEKTEEFDRAPKVTLEHLPSVILVAHLAAIYCDDPCSEHLLLLREALR